MPPGLIGPILSNAKGDADDLSTVVILDNGPFVFRYERPLMGAGLGFLGALSGMMQQDYASSSPIGLWRDDYDRRAREGEAKYYAQNKYPWAVESAKEAGLHPLFALGAAGSGGTLGGANTTIRAGGGGGGYGARSPNKAMMAAQIRTEGLRGDFLQEQIEASRAARQRQGQPYDSGEGAIVYPMGSKVGSPLSWGEPLRDRARVDYPTTSRPMKTTVIADDGARFRIIDPDTGDEVSQADLVWEVAKHYGYKSIMAVPREVRLQYRRLAAQLKRKWRRQQGRVR